MTLVRAGVLLAVLGACAMPSGAGAQTPAARRLTTLDALRQYPGYYHLQAVLVRGEISERDARLLVVSDAHEMPAVLDDGVRTLTGPVEIRGQLVDVGRLEPGDPRAGRRASGGEGNGQAEIDRWPRPGEELFVRVTGVTAAETSSTTPSVRAVALEPWKFAGRAVSLSGTFRGRNLFGDLPDAPGRSRYDFVLRGAEGAIWVTGLRPRGRGFDLDVDRRADTGRWLEVSGTIAHDRGLIRLEATRVAATEAPPPVALADEDAAPAAPPPPVEIVFNSPTDGDVDVATTDVVRVQFSKGLAEPTVAGRVQARYADPGLDPSAPQAALEFRATYNAANRAIEIRFPAGLQPGRVVRVELTEGITGFDGGVVPVWNITFTVAN